jgi:hypothetical protein
MTTPPADDAPSVGPTDQARAAPFVSLTTKLLVGLTVLFVLAFFGVSYWLDSVVAAASLASIQLSLTDTVNGAEAGINGDDFAALVRDGQPNADGQSDDPRYGDEMAWLTAVHSLDPQAEPYTYVSGPDVNRQPSNLFIVDYQDPGRTSPGFKQPWIDPNPESRAGFEELTYQLTPYTDQWEAGSQPTRPSRTPAAPSSGRWASTTVPIT